MKSTIQHYGWIVIVTLVISVMLALATPFGKYIGRGISIIGMGANEALEHAYGDGYEEQMMIYDAMFNDNAVIYKEAGLYNSGSNYSHLKTKWSDLITQGIVRQKMTDDDFVMVVTNYDQSTKNNSSAAQLNGELTIKAGPPIIGQYAFAGCNLLTSVNIKNVQLIESYAFLNCTGLKSLVIDATSLQLIAENAFSNCPNLKEIYYKGTYAEFQKIAIREQGLNGQVITVVCSDTTVKIKF